MKPRQDVHVPAAEGHRDHLSASTADRPTLHKEAYRHRRYPDMDTLEDKTLAKYQVIREIGRSKLSVVYLGHDPFIDRPVAIKVTDIDHPEVKKHQAVYQKMFFNEAQAAGMLKHPNITAIYDAGVDGSIYYIIMEYIHGEKTLADYCNPQHLLPVEDVIRIIYKCAAALDFAHRKGVIHRDVKPSNILLTVNKEVKLSDFGIALLPDLPEADLLDQLGSPLYMSPEQIRHESVGGPSDLFALGIVMYELLTGKHPYEAGNLDAINHRILNSRPCRLSELRADIPDVLERIIDRALAKDIDKRYKTGLDLAGDLSLVFDFLEQPVLDISRQEKFASARALEFFREFTDTEIWELINASTWQQIPAGENIILEGEVDKSFYIIIDGKVEVRKNHCFLDALEQGDCFGEMGFVSGKQRSASIQAITDVAIMKVQAPLIEQVSINCQLRFHKLFLHTLIERLSHATDRIVADESEPG